MNLSMLRFIFMAVALLALIAGIAVIAKRKSFQHNVFIVLVIICFGLTAWFGILSSVMGSFM